MRLPPEAVATFPPLSTLDGVPGAVRAVQCPEVFVAGPLRSATGACIGCAVARGVQTVASAPGVYAWARAPDRAMTMRAGDRRTVEDLYHLAEARRTGGHDGYVAIRRGPTRVTTLSVAPVAGCELCAELATRVSS